MQKKSSPKIVKFPAVKQRRMDLLLDKNSEGAISPKERAELEGLVKEAEQLMVENAQRIAKFSRRKGVPSGATPVTVWVQAKRSRS